MFVARCNNDTIKKKVRVVFIDDHTKFSVIYLLRYKSEVLSKLKEYVQMMFNNDQKSFALIEMANILVMKS